MGEAQHKVAGGPGRAWGIAATAVCGALFVAYMRWTGQPDSGGFAHVTDAVPVLVPLLGALGCVITTIHWGRERRRSVVIDRRAGVVYAFTLAGSVLWLLMWPLGVWVESASVEASKVRALEVAAQVQAYRAAAGRWPQTFTEVETFSGKRLPQPTLGRGWDLFRTDDSVVLAFSTDSFVSHHIWQYEVNTRRWTDYGEEERTR